MPVYTVHAPQRNGRRRDDDRLSHTARFAFVRDGFHFWAFLLAPIWMLRHRMWLEFIVYVLLLGGVTFAMGRLGVAESTGVWVALLIALLAGIEASSLRRWKLARRGFENLGVVVGEDLEHAERRFFDGWVAQGERAPPVPPQPQASPFSRPPSSGE